MATTATTKPYTVESTRFFRHHIVCSLLSGRSVVFDNIRVEGEKVGLVDYEANFLRLIDRYTNGTFIEINETGTRVRVKPGVIVGGTFTHEVPTSRAMGYCMEPLLLLAPFAKRPTEITFQGVTNNAKDIGVDTIRTVTVPLLRVFGVEANLRIKRRGAPPEGGGEAVMTCTNVRKLETVELVERGKVKRIRGVAFSARVSPDLANRAVSSAKGLLLKLLPDIFIAADHFTGPDAGLSPGYGLTLVAESTSEQSLGLSEEIVAAHKASDMGQVTAEDIGLTASKLLLEQIKKGGCVDSHHQLPVLILMAVSPEEVSRVRLGPLSPAGEEALQMCQQFFKVSFSKRRDEAYSFSPTTIYSCIGISLTNISKKSA